MNKATTRKTPWDAMTLGLVVLILGSIIYGSVAHEVACNKPGTPCFVERNAEVGH